MSKLLSPVGLYVCMFKWMCVCVLGGMDMGVWFYINIFWEKEEIKKKKGNAKSAPSSIEKLAYT